MTIWPVRDRPFWTGGEISCLRDVREVGRIEGYSTESGFTLLSSISLSGAAPVTDEINLETRALPRVLLTCLHLPEIRKKEVLPPCRRKEKFRFR